MADRVKVVVELVVAAAGLGVYLVLIGGISTWARLEAAGLPGDIALSGYDTRALSGSGLRALAVLPILALFAIVLARLDGSGGNQAGTGTSVVDGVASAALQFLVFLGGIVVGGYAALTMLVAVVSPDHPQWRDTVILAICILAPLVLWFAFAKARSGKGTAPVDGPRTFRLARGVDKGLSDTSGARRLGLAFVAVAVAGGAAFAGAEAGRSDSYTLAYLALAVITVTYVPVAFRVAAGLTATAKRLASATTVSSDALIVLGLVVVALLLPLWLAVWFVGIGLLVLLVGTDAAAGGSWWSAHSTLVRLGIVSLFVLVAVMAYGTRTPHRFDRVAIQVADDGAVVNGALLGKAGKQLLIGVCARGGSGFSEDVEVLRVAESRVPADRVAAGRYAFYAEREPTLLSGMLEGLGLPAFRPPPLHEWLIDERPENVCGSERRNPAWMLNRLRSYAPPK